MKQEGESMRTMCCVSTGRRTHKEMAGDSLISGEPEAAGWKNSKGNAAILGRKPPNPSFEME